MITVVLPQLRPLPRTIPRPITARSWAVLCSCGTEATRVASSPFPAASAGGVNLEMTVNLSAWVNVASPDFAKLAALHSGVDPHIRATRLALRSGADPHLLPVARSTAIGDSTVKMQASFGFRAPIARLDHLPIAISWNRHPQVSCL